MPTRIAYLGTGVMIKLSYPPGWHDKPGLESTCEICGLDVDACKCPVCPVCGDVGNPPCYESHGLERTSGVGRMAKEE